MFSKRYESTEVDRRTWYVILIEHLLRDVGS